MKKLLVLGLLALLAVGAVVASQGLKIREEVLPPDDKSRPVPSEKMQKIEGEHGEIIIEHPHGMDILPPKVSSPKFTGYKAYRMEVLQSLSRSSPEKKVEAMVTFTKPITPNEFDSFVASYSVVAIEGFKKDKRNFWERYSRYLLNKREVESITSAVVEGTGQELLRLQENNKVLLVDANIEGIHSRVLS
jgi:hypothetical protein